MITPTMTPLEVVQDARQDLRPLVNKLKPLSDRQARAFRKEHVPGSALESLVKWRSPRGNNWCIVLRTTKKGNFLNSLVWYRGTDERLRAVVLNITGKGTPVHITAHVLDRYLKRYDPKRDPIQRLGDFFLANHDFAFETIKDCGQGKFEVRCGMPHGMARGFWDTRQDLVDLTTFIGADTLSNKEKDLAEMLELKRYFKGLTPGQLAEAIRGIQAEIARNQAAGKGSPQDEQVLALVQHLTGMAA